MKIRFYCDLPPPIDLVERNRFLNVTTVTPISPPTPHWQRFTFDVEFALDALLKAAESRDRGDVRDVAVIADLEK